MPDITHYQVQIVFTNSEGWEVCRVLDPQPNEGTAFSFADKAIAENSIDGAEIWVLPPGSDFWKVRDNQGRIVQRKVTHA